VSVATKAVLIARYSKDLLIKLYMINLPLRFLYAVCT